MALVKACKAHALAVLKDRSPSVEDIFIDMDGLTVARAKQVSLPGWVRPKKTPKKSA